MHHVDLTDVGPDHEAGTKSEGGEQQTVVKEINEEEEQTDSERKDEDEFASSRVRRRVLRSHVSQDSESDPMKAGPSSFADAAALNFVQENDLLKPQEEEGPDEQEVEADGAEAVADVKDEADNGASVAGDSSCSSPSSTCESPDKEKNGGLRSQLQALFDRAFFNHHIELSASFELVLRAADASPVVFPSHRLHTQP